MTRGEELAIGELTGTVKSLAKQFATEHTETRASLEKVRGELALMREHRLEVAAIIAQQLASFKSEDFIPLQASVNNLIHWRIALTAAFGSGTIAGIVGFLKLLGVF